MKTKFSSIVKVKEQALKDLEALLARARGEVNRAKEALEAIGAEIAALSIPQKGSISMLQIANMSLMNLQSVKQQKKIILEASKKKVDEILKQYQKAHLEFEKMKHLEDLEVAKIVKKQKELEQKELDEISLVLYNLQTKEQKAGQL